MRNQLPKSIESLPSDLINRIGETAGINAMATYAMSRQSARVVLSELNRRMVLSLVGISARNIRTLQPLPAGDLNNLIIALLKNRRARSISDESNYGSAFINLSIDDLSHSSADDLCLLSGSREAVENLRTIDSRQLGLLALSGNLNTLISATYKLEQPPSYLSPQALVKVLELAALRGEPKIVQLIISWLESGPQQSYLKRFISFYDHRRLTKALTPLVFGLLLAAISLVPPYRLYSPSNNLAEAFSYFIYFSQIAVRIAAFLLILHAFNMLLTDPLSHVILSPILNGEMIRITIHGNPNRLLSYAILSGNVNTANQIYKLLDAPLVAGRPHRSLMHRYEQIAYSSSRNIEMSRLVESWANPFRLFRTMTASIDTTRAAPAVPPEEGRTTEPDDSTSVRVRRRH